MNVTVYGPNLPGTGETFHVHQTGCKDTTRGIYKGIRIGGDQGGWALETESLQEVVEDIYSDQINESGDPWDAQYLDDVKFFPCTAGLAHERI